MSFSISSARGSALGKHARIQELEAQLEAERRKSALTQAIRDFIVIIAQLPDDAVLLYTVSGQRVQCEVGRAAKCLLSRL